MDIKDRKTSGKKGTFFERCIQSDGIVPKLLQNDSPETGDEVKKNPIEKCFFIMEKKYVEKKFSIFFRRKKYDFLKNHVFLEKTVDFFRKKK